ncbi:SpoIID/LytB domain-containing protein, partial [uncultured Pseudokineococcus sp.]|uniref:SpoIID/LytB domain-containing protein n=1 Tax=uncultured Pseudokineococcus sp. TaxID=1642928 RepID=UPI00261D67EC
MDSYSAPRRRVPARRAGRRRAATLLTSLVTAFVAAVAPLPASASTGASCPPAGGTPPAELAAPAGADFVVRGHGFGHGLGMSQYGARGAALLGCSSDTILRTYYPGLVPRTVATRGRVVVRMLDAGGAQGRAALTAEDGPVTWRTGSSAVVQPAGSTWTVGRGTASGLVVRSGASSDAPVVGALMTTSTTPLRAQHDGATVRLATWGSTGALGLVRRSSGDEALFNGGSSGLSARLVMVDGERGSAVAQYLGGLAEMPLSWPSAAQEAQVVAARSYLLARWSDAESGYLVRPTTSDQVWKGADQQEADARAGGHLARAVARTTDGATGVVMTTASGALARDLFYAASHGGWSESNAYVWGTPQVAHLRPVDDSRWDAAASDPYRSWVVGLSRAQAARAFGFTSVSAVEVAPRGSASRTAVVVRGVRGGVATTASFTGQQARDRLAGVDAGVRSSGFEVSASEPPAPVPAPVPVPEPVRSMVGGVPLTGDWDGNGRAEPGW